MIATQASTPTLFDYSALVVESRIVVQQKTGEIRERVRRAADDIRAIGERLLVVKGHLEHGEFGNWLAAEFGWSESAARKMMAVAERFKTVNFTDLTIGPSALYLLASDTFTDDERAEAVQAAQSGEKITHAAVKAKAEAKKAVVRRSTVDTQLADADGEDQSQLTTDDAQVQASVSRAEYRDRLASGAEPLPVVNRLQPAAPEAVAMVEVVAAVAEPDVDSVEAAQARRAHADASDELLTRHRMKATVTVRVTDVEIAVRLADEVFATTRKPFNSISTIDLRQTIEQLRDAVRAIAAATQEKCK